MKYCLNPFENPDISGMATLSTRTISHHLAYQLQAAFPSNYNMELFPTQLILPTPNELWKHYDAHDKQVPSVHD